MDATTTQGTGGDGDIAATSTDPAQTGNSAEAAAKAFMPDFPIDLGAIGSGAITLTEQITRANSGLFTNVIVGNGRGVSSAAAPMAAGTAPSHADLAQSPFGAAFGGAAADSGHAGVASAAAAPLAADGQGFHQLWSALHGHA